MYRTSPKLEFESSFSASSTPASPPIPMTQTTLKAFKLVKFMKNWCKFTATKCIQADPHHLQILLLQNKNLNKLHFSKTPNFNSAEGYKLLKSIQKVVQAKREIIEELRIEEVSWTEPQMLDGVLNILQQTQRLRILSLVGSYGIRTGILGGLLANTSTLTKLELRGCNMKGIISHLTQGLALNRSLTYISFKLANIENEQLFVPGVMEALTLHPRVAELHFALNTVISYHTFMSFMQKNNSLTSFNLDYIADMTNLEFESIVIGIRKAPSMKCIKYSKNTHLTPLFKGITGGVHIEDINISKFVTLTPEQSLLAATVLQTCPNLHSFHLGKLEVLHHILQGLSASDHLANSQLQKINLWADRADDTLTEKEREFLFKSLGMAGRVNRITNFSLKHSVGDWNQREFRKLGEAIDKSRIITLNLKLSDTKDAWKYILAPLPIKRSLTTLHLSLLHSEEALTELFNNLPAYRTLKYLKIKSECSNLSPPTLDSITVGMSNNRSLRKIKLDTEWIVTEQQHAVALASHAYTNELEISCVFGSAQMINVFFETLGPIACVWEEGESSSGGRFRSQNPKPQKPRNHGNLNIIDINYRKSDHRKFTFPFPALREFFAPCLSIYIFRLGISFMGEECKPQEVEDFLINMTHQRLLINGEFKIKNYSEGQKRVFNRYKQIAYQMLDISFNGASFEGKAQDKKVVEMEFARRRCYEETIYRMRPGRPGFLMDWGFDYERRHMMQRVRHGVERRRGGRRYAMDTLDARNRGERYMRYRELAQMDPPVEGEDIHDNHPLPEHFNLTPDMLEEMNDLEFLMDDIDIPSPHPSPHPHTDTDADILPAIDIQPIEPDLPTTTPHVEGQEGATQVNLLPSVHIAHPEGNNHIDPPNDLHSSHQGEADEQHQSS